MKKKIIILIDLLKNNLIFFIDTTHRECMACHSNCDVCVGPLEINCLSCNSGFYL
jgi:hypothetical protein